MNDSTRDLYESRERLTRDLRTVVDDAEQLLRHGADGATTAFAEARTRLEGSVQGARGRLADAEEAIAARVRGAAQSTEQYVRENPWQAIGFGAAVGLLIGLMARRR